MEQQDVKRVISRIHIENASNGKVARDATLRNSLKQISALRKMFHQVSDIRLTDVTHLVRFPSYREEQRGTESYREEQREGPCPGILNLGVFGEYLRANVRRYLSVSSYSWRKGCISSLRSNFRESRSCSLF